MTSDPTNSNTPEHTPSLADTLAPLLTDLLYPSESDEPIETVTCYLDQEAPLTVSQIKDWLMVPPSTFVEEVPETEFWDPVITEEDWFGDEEKQRTGRFQALKKVLDEQLTCPQVFRVGDTEVDLYLLGRTNEGARAGLKTKVIET